MLAPLAAAKRNKRGRSMCTLDSLLEACKAENRGGGVDEVETQTAHKTM